VQLQIQSDERDTQRREDLREPSPRWPWLRATAIPSGDDTTRERPVNRSGIRPLEREERATAQGSHLTPARRRVEPREMPLVLSDGGLCVSATD
jgi:hypothetical protein